MNYQKLLVICALEAEGLLDGPKRHYWVHPFNELREKTKRFSNFYENIRKYEDKFINYYRMSISSFDELLNIVRPHIAKQFTNFRYPISPQERLSLTLRYLATGNNFSALECEFHVAKSTISSIIRETCQVIWNCLKDIEMSKPTKEKWLEIADTFYTKTNFPNCVGAVDVKYIKCNNFGTNFAKHKKKFSVVLMAAVDADLRFIAIDVGGYGPERDLTDFRDSSLGSQLYSGSLNLPEPRLLPHTDSHPQPFVMVADEAFKIHTNLLRPYPKQKLDSSKRVYNYRLSRCRRSVECAFSALANKWRIFYEPILVEPNFVDDIIKSCCVLHNFVQKRDGFNSEDIESYPFVDVIHAGTSPRGHGIEVRDFFANYFIGPGAVPFQQNFMF